MLPDQVPLPVTGQGTEFDALVDKQVSHLGPLTGTVEFLGEPHTQFLDAGVLLGEHDRPYQPGTGGPDDPVSLILVAPTDPHDPDRRR